MAGVSTFVNAYLRLIITDTLSVLVDGCHAFNPLAKVTRTFWYRLPRAWFCSGQLVPDRRAQLLRLAYGPDWNGCDGCGPYIILELNERVLSDEEAVRRPWLSDRAACYAWREGDVLENVIPAWL